MPLHESLTAEDLERFRAYVASFPPSNAADRTMPTVASPSEPSPSLLLSTVRTIFSSWIGCWD